MNPNSVRGSTIEVGELMVYGYLEELKERVGGVFWYQWKIGQQRLNSGLF